LYAAAISLGVAMTDTGAADWVAKSLLALVDKIGAGCGLGFDAAISILSIGVSNTITAAAAVAVLGPAPLNTAPLAGQGRMLTRTRLSDRQERAVQKTLQHLRQQRRNRFRILACIDGSEESFITVNFAARLALNDECDIIVLYVRPIDQALWSGGLQLRIARQNMMDSGFELPGVRDLRRSLAILKEEGIDVESWPQEASHQDAWGDPAGDTKVEYRSPKGRSVVLKLKTAPDAANGILDQYELG